MRMVKKRFTKPPWSSSIARHRINRVKVPPHNLILTVRMQMRILEMTNDKSPAQSALARFTKASDGIDHINISPQGKTELGVLLAHFTEARFTHEYLGPFNCMEGYWYYVKTATPDDKLRSLVGKAAYQYGKGLPSIRRRCFQEIIMDGNYFKISQNPDQGIVHRLNVAAHAVLQLRTTRHSDQPKDRAMARAGF